MLGFFFASGLVLLGATDIETGETWPGFRGPAGNGVISSTALPLQWDTQTNVRWKIANPGEGWSSPVIWGDRLFLTAAFLEQPPRGESQSNARPQPYEGGGGTRRSDLLEAIYRWEVHCIDVFTGETLWKRVARRGPPPIPRHSSNSYATETPVTDGERVYAYFGMTGVYCYNFDGVSLWEQDLGVYEMRAGWGTASSPTCHDGKLFVQVDNQEQSFLIALNAKTGTEVWRVMRNETSQYSSPFIWTNRQRVELVVGGEFYRSYDFESGRLLWQLDMAKGRSSATPTATDDCIFIGTELRSRGGPDDGGGFLFAVKAGAEGDITPRAGQDTSRYVVWRCAQSGIEMASPVVCQGFIYLLERRSGIVRCVNADTGEMAYRKRIPGARAFWASPLAVGDKVYCLDSDGTTHVLQGGPDFTVLARNALGEQAWSTPAVAHDRLFLRSIDHLYCVGRPDAE